MGYQQRGWIWGIVTVFTALVSPACAQTPIDPNRDRFPQQLPTPTPLTRRSHRAHAYPQS
jgi:hypothetical protein